MKLEGRAAIVTGGNRGIGRAIALELARQGADVAFNYRGDEESAKATASEIEALGRKTLARQTNVTDNTAVESMVAEAIDLFGAVDILVCNAGVASRGNHLGETEAREMRRLLDVHLFGALHFARALLPCMRTRERSDVHFISSTSPFRSEAGHGPYATAKACVETLAMTMAKDERQYGVRVNVIAPGLVETEMGKRLVKATQGVDDIKEIYPKYPFRRVCQPEDIAKLSAFLASEDGGYVSGHVIHLDGGMSR